MWAYPVPMFSSLEIEKSIARLIFWQAQLWKQMSVGHNYILEKWDLAVLNHMRGGPVRCFIVQLKPATEVNHEENCRRDLISNMPHCNRVCQRMPQSFNITRESKKSKHASFCKVTVQRFNHVQSTHAELNWLTKRRINNDNSERKKIGR